MRYLSIVYYKGIFLRTMHKNWDIIKTMSVYENKVKSHIETDIRNSSKKDNIVNIILTFEKVLHFRNVNKILIEKVNLSGIVIIEAFLYGEILHSIKNIPGGINFLTDKKGGKSIPMKKQDITYLLLKGSELAYFELRISFSIGKPVNEIDGPFKIFNGTIDTINEEKQRLYSPVLIFGRKSPLDINLFQVLKR